MSENTSPATPFTMPPTPDPPSGPVPLVLLHGLGQSPIAWQDFVSAFGAGRAMSAPWLTGLRPKDRGAFDLGTAASGVVRDLELQGVRQVDLVGVTIGASIALHIAAHHPQLVRRLVVAAPLLRPGRMALRVQRAALRVMPESRLLEAGVSRERMAALLDSLRDLDGTEVLGMVAAPTLVVAGARDRAGQAAAQLVATAMPTAVREVVDGAGAAVNTERPRELAALVHTHLDA